ncbi:HNH endonuclease [Peribacillus kribbensis]|uniref:HNH endonuclease n=1 Tax=Peribacillus kribbensis TaxID=356658 RepID=UPI00047B82A5|nr:HNH endonuclease [Peribacillus kribbensis]
MEEVEANDTIKEIPGYSNYLADIEKGHIYSKKLGKWLNSKPNDIGYVYNWLVDDQGESSPVGVHCAVMSAAIEFPISWWKAKNLQVDHRNRIKHDNCFANLKLVTKKKNHENIYDRKESKRLKKEDVQFIKEAFGLWTGRKIDFYKAMAEEFGCVWQTIQYTVLGYSNKNIVVD